MKRFLLCIIVCFTISPAVLAQDPLFSQFYYAPVYTNPGLAGTMRNNMRLTAITRMQWTRIKQPFIYSNLALEKHLPGPQASFALSFNRFSEGYLRTTGAYLTLAKNFGNRTDDCHDLFINMAIQIGWAWKGLNTRKLLFSDQLDETKGILGIDSEAEILRQPNQNYLDAGAGVVATWRSWCVGSGLHHINRPHDGLGGSSRSSKLPMRFTAHLSYSSEKDPTYNQSIIVKPTAMLHVQGKSSSLSVGTLVDFKDYFIELGIWYRHNADLGGNNSHSISAGLNFRIPDRRGGYNNGVDRRSRLGTSVDAYIYNPSNRNTGLSFETGGFNDSRSPYSDYEGLCPSGDCPNKFPWQFF